VSQRHDFGVERSHALRGLDDLFAGRARVQGAARVSQQLRALIESRECGHGEELASTQVEIGAREHAAIGEAEDILERRRIQGFELVVDARGDVAVDQTEELFTAAATFVEGRLGIDVPHMILAKPREQLLVSRERTREAGEEQTLQAELAELVAADACGLAARAEPAQRLAVLAAQRGHAEDEDAFARPEHRASENGVERRVGHPRRVLAALGLALLLFGCSKESKPGVDSAAAGGAQAATPQSGADQALRGYSFSEDPLRVPGLGSMPRPEFRHFVCTELASGWARFKALSLHLATRIEAGPERVLLARMRAHARSGRFDELLPAPRGQWRSETAELDLATLLARLWMLERPAASLPLETEELVGLLRSALEEHAPELVKDPADWERLARCGEGRVLVGEIYPDLLSLLEPRQRERLLEKALRSR
jgi:hypothetical protein